MSVVVVLGLPVSSFHASLLSVPPPHCQPFDTQAELHTHPAFPALPTPPHPLPFPHPSPFACYFSCVTSLFFCWDWAGKGGERLSSLCLSPLHAPTVLFLPADLSLLVSAWHALFLYLQTGMHAFKKNTGTRQAWAWADMPPAHHCWQTICGIGGCCMDWYSTPFCVFARQVWLSLPHSWPWPSHVFCIVCLSCHGLVPSSVWLHFPTPTYSQVLWHGMSCVWLSLCHPSPCLPSLDIYLMGMYSLFWPSL